MKKKKGMIIAISVAVILVVATIIVIILLSNKPVTISFDTDGGSSISPITLEKKGMTLTPPKDPTKDGYIFLNWSLDGNEFDFSTPIREDVTLTAEWIKEIKVTLVYDNGKNDEVIKIKQGDLLKVDAPQKKGYKFIGWQKEDKTMFVDTSPIKEDMTLRATYKTIYTVIFTSDDQQIQKSEVLEGEKVKQPNIQPSKTGYNFLGWFNGEEQFNFNKPITSDLTLVAKFKLIPIEPTSVAFTQTVYKIQKGESISTSTLLTPNNTNSKNKLSYSSDNTDVATIDEYGIIKAINGGKATITVKTENGKSATAIIYVEDQYIYATWNSPSQEVLNIYKNSTVNEANIYLVRYSNGQRSQTEITSETGLNLIVDNYQDYLDITFTTAKCSVKAIDKIDELTTTVTTKAYFSYQSLKTAEITLRLEPTLKISSVKNAVEYSQNDITIAETGSITLTLNCLGSFNVSETIEPVTIIEQTIEFTLLEEASEGHIYFTSVCGQTIDITVHR